MIEKHWPRICGIHIQRDGQVAAVWLAHDKDADVVHVYDCHLHSREVVAVQAESLKRRGKWIPVAWHEDGRAIIDKLQEHGCATLPECAKDSDAIAEASALDIWERMRTGRFKVRESLSSWLDEFRTYYRQDGAVPTESHPLMAATRHAVEFLDWARANKAQKIEYPKMAIV